MGSRIVALPDLRRAVSAARPVTIGPGSSKE
jgi:hypothetical protein